MIRYRLRWSRNGKLRYLSAHDVASVFERSTRRAKLPLAYSQGFSPHPKIGFATALPVGYASRVELLDMTLTEALEPDEVSARMNAALPEGLRIEGVVRLEGSAVKLGNVAAASDYVIRHNAPWLPEALARFMALDRYDFERAFKGSTRVDDLRAGVLDASADGAQLNMRCALVPRAVRPTDVIDALARIAAEEPPHVQVERVMMLADVEGVLVPIDEAGTREAVAS